MRRHLHVGGGRGGAAHRPSGNAGIGAEREFVLQKFFNPGVVHEQQYKVRRREPQLKSHAAATESEGRRSAPGSLAKIFLAEHVPGPVAASKSEGEFLDAGNDPDTLAPFEQVFGDAAVGGVQDGLKHAGGVFQPFFLFRSSPQVACLP